MGQRRETDPNSDTQSVSALGSPSAVAVTQFKIDEKKRWKRRITSLIFVGLLISLLIHLNIAIVLQLFTSGGSGDTPSGALTTIEFAILEEEAFAELPQGDQELVQESQQTEATAQTMDSTQAVLQADETTSTIQQTSSSMTPSLAGGGSSGMGAGIGGSGGAGTSFFGIASGGSRFCYIVDISGSMTGDRLTAAIEELTKSLKKLPDFSRFYILFFSSGYQEPTMQLGWNTARSSTVNRIVREIQTVRAGGHTAPHKAFVKAFELNPPPEVIFLLTDGQITGFSVEMLRALIPKRSRVTINTIAFGTEAEQELLRAIARETGGQFKFVKSAGNK